MFIVDSGNNRIIKIVNGKSSIFAGNQTTKIVGDGEKATETKIYPTCVCGDTNGNIYFCSDNRIRKIGVNGIISTVSGSTTGGFSGDGGNAIMAKLRSPVSCAVSDIGDIYIADQGNNRVRFISASSGNISTVVGGDNPNNQADGSSATGARLYQLAHVYMKNSELYVTDRSGSNIRRVTPEGKIYSVLKDGLNYPSGLTFINGELFIIDGLTTGRLLQISEGNLLKELVKNSIGDGDVSTYAKVSWPYAVHSTDNELFISEDMGYRIRKVVLQNKTISTVAGIGSAGYAGDNSLAINAKINTVRGIYVTQENSIYFTDSGNHCIRKIVDGVITLVAGTPTTQGFLDGPATNSKMASPEGISIFNGEIYFVDSGNSVLRKIDKNLLVSTIAGIASQSGYAGDGGSPLTAKFNNPTGLAISKNGTIFIADTGNNRIRRIMNGKIETIAGTGEESFDYDPKTYAIESALNQPIGVYVSLEDEIYFTDYRNSLIRKITTDGKLVTIAGRPSFFAFDGEDVVVLEDNTGFFYIKGITGTSSGELFVADLMNDKVRVLMPYNSSSDFTCGSVLKYDRSVCSGVGVCKSPDTCQCDEGFTGDNCQVSVCFGKLANESNVCGGKGYCTSPNACSCGKDYFGNECQYFGCFGVSSNSNNTCSGNGQCISSNHCQCNKDWRGENCAIYSPYCFDINAENKTFVCSGKGSCISSDVCNCTNGYMGKLCQDFYCNNIFHNDTSVCHKKGSCVGPNNCNCSIGYAGNDCEKTFCFGILQDDASVCSFNGTCVDLNQCQCKRGFYGDMCEIVHWNETEDNDFCFGVNKNESTVCSGNGICSSKDQCSCNLGYSGESCQFITCDGFSSNDPYACYGNGNCTSYNLCECNSKFEGRYCQLEKKTMDVKYENMSYVLLPIAGYDSIGDGIDAKISYINGAGFHITNGTIYIADGLNHIVRKLDLNTGLIFTIAGQKQKNGFKNGPSLSALFDYVSSVFATNDGIIYVVDRNNHALRKIDTTSGIVTTIAGTGVQKLGGEGIAANISPLNSPIYVQANSKGEIFVSEYNRIRKINVDGIIKTIAGDSTSGFSGDGGLATSCKLSAPTSFFLNEDGSILIADSSNRRIRKISSSGYITTIAGNGGNLDTGSTNPLQTGFDDPSSVFQNSAGEIFVADTWKNKIRKISADLQTITTIVGNGQQGYNGDNILATNTKLYGPNTVANYLDDVYINDSVNNRIRRVSSIDNMINTIAGSGSFGSGRDNVLATTSQLYEPTTVVFKGEDILIADSNNRKIKKVSSQTGLITTIIGTGVVNDFTCNDNTKPLQCGISYPSAISMTSQNDIIFTDKQYNYLLKYSNNSDTISTIAGVKGYSGSTGDNGLAIQAKLYGIKSTWVHSNGDIYISDSENNRIRKISNQIISTIAGTGGAGLLGDGGAAISAQLNSPAGLFMSSTGELFIADEKNHKIRKINKNGIIETVIGTGSPGVSPDGVDPLSASLKNPKHMILIGTELYILDSGNNKVIKFDPTFKTNITTVIGVSLNGNYSKTLYSELNNPYSMAYHNGQLIISDFGNHIVKSLQPVCYGVEARNPTVCYGNGVCTSPNNCTCNSNYYGKDCSQHYCYGTLFNDEKVCNGNGRCTLPNTCECKLGWIGKFCNISIPTHQCFGVFNFDSSVCSSHGSCISKNKCNCTIGYGGEECQYNICNNVMSNNQSVCSANGKCNLPGVCTCNNGYMGNNCEYFRCGSLPSNSPEVCNGHGSCVSPWTCECKPNYDGNDCDQPICWGFINWNPNMVCSGHGTCVSPNNCSCVTGYVGEKCSIPLCYGVWGNSSSVCSGNGKCSDYNNCECIVPYYGTNCEKKQERYRMQYSISTIAGYDPESSPLQADATYIVPYGIHATNDYLFISSSSLIRKVDLKTKSVTTIAGKGGHVFSNNDGPFENVPATTSILKTPDGISVFNDGLYFVDWNVHRALRVDLVSGNISIVAGNGESGFSWIEEATKSPLSGPNDILVAPNGYIFIADTGNNRIRVVINGTISTICGGNWAGYRGDGGIATDGILSAPQGIFLTKQGDLLISDLGNNRIRKISNILSDLGKGIITTVAGNGKKGWSGDGGSALDASFNFPSSVVMDSYGNMFICDYYNHLIRMVSNTTGNVSTIAGARVMGAWGGQWVPIGSSDSDEPKPAKNATFEFPMRMTINGDNLFISDTNNKRVRMISLQTGIISTTIGYGKREYNGENKLANQTTLGEVFCIQHYNGEIFFTDKALHIIRKITKTGVIKTVAGMVGISGYIGDGGQASLAKLNSPLGVFVSSKGEIYFCDSANYVIRKISVGGNITTIIGTGTKGYSNDGFDALDTSIDFCISVNMLSTGEVIFSEMSRIRKLGMDGKITTIAGGVEIFKDSVSAISSKILTRSNIVVSPSNELFFVCEGSGIRLRKVSKEGIITTVVGNGKNNMLGPDNVIAVKYPVGALYAVALLSTGEIIVQESARIRKVLPSGYIYTIAGSSENDVYNGDFQRATLATFRSAAGKSIIVVNDKILLTEYFGDQISYEQTRIRELTPFIPTCYSKTANSSSVCYARGDCISQDNCVCDSQYYGNECTEFDCFGIWRNNSNVCSKNGTCIAPEVCKCDSLYTGAKCEVPICYGFSANNSQVCSYRNGTCVKGNLCNCNSNYTGYNCQFPICYNISSNESSVCSGHGSCYLPDTCICKRGFTGKNCNLPICYSKVSNEIDVCSGYGTCTYPDTCKCDYEYFGNMCETTRCYGRFSNESITCLGNGNCSAPNNCICNSNYTGYECQFPICFGLSSNDSGVCSTHGKCINPDICKCNNDYYGPYCNITTCNGSYSNDLENVCSGNGTCFKPDTCSCKDGFSGFNCELKLCNGTLSNDSSACYGNGNCIWPDICQCKEGYYGKWCDLFTCFSLPFYQNSSCSGNGKCSSYNYCTCSKEYFGDNCETTRCFGTFSNSTNVCSGKGSCILPNVCQCRENYFGDNCELYSCNSTLYNQSNVCSGNGICISPDNCKCYEGYSGSICQDITCNGVLSSNETFVCSGRGICTAPNNCNCISKNNTKVYGQDCEKLQCLGENGKYYSPTSPKVCSGRGTCSINGCECKKGLLGDYCQIETCYGLPSYELGVCNGRGSCLSVDKCVCFENETTGYWGGYECNTCLPSHTGVDCLNKICNDTTTCSDHGKCNSTTLDCECNGGWDGKFCNTCKKNMFGSGCDMFCESTTTCSAHGLCNTNGSCDCYGDDSNGYWSSSSCDTCQSGHYGEMCSTYFVGPPQFTDLGNGINLKVFGPRSLTNVNVNCTKLLRLEDIQLFGEGVLCMWTNKDDGSFLIQFGDRYNLRPGMNISLNRLVFDSQTISQTDYEVLTVLNANNPVKPVSVISNIRNSIGLCDDVDIDGSKSFSGDRKSLIFKWAWEKVPDVELYDLFNNSDTTQNSTILLPATCSEGEYTISLIVKSSLSGAVSEQVTFTFVKFGLPLPYISIVGKNSVTIKSSQIPFVIRPEVSFPNCFYENRNYSISWKQTSALSLVTETDNLGNLIITGFTDTKLEGIFDFEVVVVSEENPQSKSSTKSSVSITFEDLLLNTYISELYSDMAIINVEYEDPDDSDETETWLWTCKEQVTNEFCDEKLDTQLASLSFHKNSSFSIIPQYMKSIILTLTIKKGSRSKSHDQLISFPPSKIIPPIVSLLNVNPKTPYIVKGVLYSLQLSVSIGGVEDGIDIQRQWSLNSQPIPNSITNQMASDPLSSNSIIIDTSYLEEGSTYILSLNATATVSQLSATYSQVFKIARSPQSCECSITPSKGYIIDTEFKFECFNCQNQEKTIDFIYGYIDESTGSQVPLYILGEAYPTRLPPPDDGKSNIIRTFIKIVDTSTGASCTKYLNVNIYYPIVNNLDDLLSKMLEWNNLLSDQMTNSNPSKMAVTGATISKAVSILASRIVIFGYQSRSLKQTCLNGGIFDNSTLKCNCPSGYIKEDCSLSIKDQSIKNQMRQVTVKNYQKSLNLRNNAELLTENYLKSQLIGLIPITQLYDEIDPTLFNSVCSLMSSTLILAQNNKNLKLVNTENALKTFFISIDKYIQYNSIKDQNTIEIATSLISEYSSLIVRNKDVGQAPLSIESNTITLLISKNYMDQLSSKIVSVSDTKVRTPALISRFLKSYPKRKPLTYSLKILNGALNETSIVSSRKSTITSSLISNMVDFSLQEYKLVFLPQPLDFIRYEIPLKYNPSNSSYLTSTPVEVFLGKTEDGNTISKTYKKEYLVCLNKDSNNQWNENEDCLFEYDNKLPNYGVCKCSKQSSVAIALNTLNRIEVETTSPQTNTMSGSKLEYLGFLAFLIVPMIIGYIISIIVAVRCLKKKRNPAPPQNIELGVV